jgi:hypothetical protein
MDSTVLHNADDSVSANAAYEPGTNAEITGSCQPACGCSAGGGSFSAVLDMPV